MATADYYVWSPRKAQLVACRETAVITHPIIGDPIIVIIMVTFITQAVFVVIFLARVGEAGAVIL